MKKSIVMLSSALILTAVSAQAALYKGQKVYSKVCIKCHTSGVEFVGGKTQFEWESYMDNKGKKLVETHLESDKFKEDEDYKKYKKYFESNKFKKRTKHLKEFLMEYAEDSGNVASCS
ncbi:cytochrome C [Sulfurimonas sp.]|uniref:cytochrome C n=1 Tax=Sulfurimonas sp. TaxID=2022749 RepID=UPI003562B70C